MKITANRKALLSAWKTAAAAVPSRTPMEILKSIKCSAKDGVLWLTSTDKEVSIRARVDASVEEPGECLLPADKTLAVLQAATAESTSFTSVGPAIEIRSGSSRVKLPTAKVEEFPVVDTPSAVTFTLSAEQLQAGLDFTATCVNPKSPFSMCGIYIGEDKGRLVFGATDGNRLAIHESVEVTAFSGVVIPPTAADCLRKAEFSGQVSVSVTPGRVLFESEKVVIGSPIQQGSWPVVALTFPAAGKVYSTCRVASGIWAGIWNQVKATAIEESMGAVLSFGETLSLSHSSSIGESESSCPAEFTGGPSSIELGIDYVMSLSKVFEPIEVLDVEAADFKGFDYPTCIRAKCGTRSYIIMSMGDDKK